MAFYELNRFSDTIAFQTEHQQIEYGELETIAQNFALYLEPRSLVLQFCANTLGSAVGYVAFLHNKVVPLLVDQAINQHLVQQLIDNYRPQYLYVPSAMEPLLNYESKLAQYYDYSLLKMTQTITYNVHPELALLLTTSGSTGSRKLVRLSYTNLHSNAESIAQYLALDASERPITTLPMNYTYGLSVLNSHLNVGARLLITSAGLLEAEFWRLFREQQATSIAGVPYTYQILKKLQLERMKLPSLRTMTQAGGHLPVSLHQEFAAFAKQHGIKFIVMYGQTEATARMSYLPHQHASEKIGSIGIAIPNGYFELYSPDHTLIHEAHTVGELVYHGPNVSMGYAQSYLDLAKGDELLGSLKTGDMAMRDEENYYYIVGRLSRFLKMFGVRVNLDEVEQLLQEHFTGLSFACVGEDDLMSIFVTSHDELQIKEIRRFLNEKTGINMTGFVVRPIVEIPKNEAGKIKYSELT